MTQEGRELIFAEKLEKRTFHLYQGNRFEGGEELLTHRCMPETYSFSGMFYKRYDLHAQIYMM